ncbi:SDR family oxidoreductase [Leucobacter chromiiresistens]|uniref:NAD(P)-dependent dehydrogenase, short-chain alcohol dehydrogenase family n=1 Tax=Leucobacter chromiiresistens TaxID=1079994 RepID=A0A1H0XRV9_9MICO|nr:SDR family oxidoreductase [Leucobacter chromiiresistens]SDQ05630.1 NAD(P)-dependent dehydrogenase, short-chain alcohol dehydrogenase family [Leucobacter chromiiresistens]
MKFEDLQGRAAVVTGGGRGLGLSLAEALAGQGVDVALLDVLPDVEATAERLAERFGVRAIGIPTDVTDPEQISAAFDRIDAALGTPRVLLTAAGITLLEAAVDIDPVQWRRLQAINVDGTFFVAQEFARRLLAAQLGGSAILVSSMSAKIINVPQQQTAYNTSKAAVDHLTRSLAVEWAGAGIRVNAIAPGYFLSDMTKQFTESNPELAAEWTSRIPLGRMGDPADLHGLVAFLASDASAYLTAQSIVIDGGYTAL